MADAAFGIFEGGGAKGLAHIAALKAVEYHGYEFIGVAGASAGALIASLVAVGYKADELFDPLNPVGNLLSRHNVRPLSLIGERDWETFSKAERLISATRKSLVRGLPTALWRGRAAARVGIGVWRHGGYFSTAIVRHTLNKFLRDKLRAYHAMIASNVAVPDRIRFSNINPNFPIERGLGYRLDNCCPLKIIVTDVTNQRMVVFDSTDPAHGDVEVAEVAAASIAIPGVFQAASILSYPAGRGARYADGGLVSNFPVWVFQDEKLNYERHVLPKGRVPIIAFSLTGPPEADGPASSQSGLDYFGALGRTAVFGGQSVARRFAADVQVIELPTRLGVAEFDLRQERALDAYYDASVAAMQKIKREMRDRPARIRQLLGEFHQHTLAVLANVQGQKTPNHLRVFLLQPDGPLSFRVTSAFGADDFADDRLTFSRLASGAPSAFERKEPSFLDFGAIFSQGPGGGLTKYEMALLPRHLSTSICLPIFLDAAEWSVQPSLRDPPRGVVTIDSDVNLHLAFSDPEAMRSLATRSIQLGPALP